MNIEHDQNIIQIISRWLYCIMPGSTWNEIVDISNEYTGDDPIIRIFINTVKDIGNGYGRNVDNLQNRSVA